MQWVAPSEKDSATDTLEKRLWDCVQWGLQLMPTNSSNENLGLDGLPRAYPPELYQQKCSSVYEHIYESYPQSGVGVYAGMNN